MTAWRFRHPDYDVSGDNTKRTIRAERAEWRHAENVQGIRQVLQVLKTKYYKSSILLCIIPQVVTCLSTVPS